MENEINEHLKKRYFYKYFSVSQQTEAENEANNVGVHITHTHTYENASADTGPLTMQHPASPVLRWKILLATIPNSQQSQLAAQIQRD